ncbi:MAG: hypothetical protein OXH92_12945 [Bryobacterales bacterium]|nr:hypothetical protein [Bryobacterales bacterium]
MIRWAVNFEIMVKKIVGHLARLEALSGGDLTEVNDVLKQFGIDDIVPGGVVLATVS